MFLIRSNYHCAYLPASSEDASRDRETGEHATTLRKMGSEPFPRSYLYAEGHCMLLAQMQEANPINPVHGLATASLASG